MMTLGEAIRRWKTKTGSSADDLARAVGCSRRTVFDWQAGRSVPGYDLRPALADALGLSVDDLLDVIEHAPESEPSLDVADDARVAVAVERWRRNVIEAHVPLGVCAVLMALPSYMLITGEVRVTCEQLAQDLGWPVRDVCSYMEQAERTQHVARVRTGVYKLRALTS